MSNEMIRIIARLEFLRELMIELAEKTIERPEDTDYGRGIAPECPLLDLLDVAINVREAGSAFDLENDGCIDGKVLMAFFDDLAQVVRIKWQMTILHYNEGIEDGPGFLGRKLFPFKPGHTLLAPGGIGCRHPGLDYTELVTARLSHAVPRRFERSGVWSCRAVSGRLRT
jgi:hypothetical protein